MYKFDTIHYPSQFFFLQYFMFSWRCWRWSTPFR